MANYQAKTTIRTLPMPIIQKTRKNYKLRSQTVAYLFLLPSLLVFALVTWYPMVTTIINSFQKVSLHGESTWVGLQNYSRMLGNPLFGIAWFNIIQFATFSVVMGFMVPIILALMMNEMRQLGPLFQRLVYLPTLIPIAVALLIWRQIYAPEGGVLNSFLGLLGMEGQLWLQNPVLVKPAMIVIMTWLGAGGSVLIYLSALQEIPTDIYESAELEGVASWQRIWYITLPLIAHRMKIMLVLQIIVIAQIFNEPFILTAGGPANSTITPVLEIYRTAFERNDFGLAAAWSTSMLVILSVFSALYVWLSRRSGEEN
jgi:multiple sugar transport system permease protein